MLNIAKCYVGGCLYVVGVQNKVVTIAILEFFRDPEIEVDDVQVFVGKFIAQVNCFPFDVGPSAICQL